MRYPEDFINKIICSDCLGVMRGMPDNCIDTIITDPPYGLEFMGKEWDRLSGKGRYQKGGVWQEVKGYSPPAYKGGNEAQKWHYNWATEALRVAKPGSTLLCFGGTRTYHRLACAIEDAGWIIKDCIMWLYGSGFPKASDISKQIDKEDTRQFRKIVGQIIKKFREQKGWSMDELCDKLELNNEGHGGMVNHYENGRATPTIELWKKICELLDIKEIQDYKKQKKGRLKEIGKIENPISWFGAGIKKEITTSEAQLWNGWKSHGLKPAYEPILVCMKPNEGSYANNALKWGVAGLNIDGGRLPYEEGGTVASNPKLRVERGCKTETGDRIFCQGELGKKNTMVENVKKGGRYPANVILDEESASLLDEQAPKTGAFAKVKSGHSGKSKGIYHEYAQRGDNGETFYADGLQGASRFFYCAKASKAERNRGCEGLENVKFTAGNYSQSPVCKDCGKTLNGINDHSNCSGEIEYREMKSKKTGNNHPTVKPLALMKYLCTLTRTPTGGIVLDPFCGSGTTLIACKELKRDYIGIDKIPEYCEIARNRIKAIPELLF